MPQQSEDFDKVEGIDEEEVAVEEETLSLEIDGTLQFNRCQYVAVYIKSGNSSGNKVEDSGNIVPQVIRMSSFFLLASSVLIISCTIRPWWDCYLP